MPQPELKIDPAFDDYQICMWNDLRYRVKRVSTRGTDYLARNNGGEFVWQKSAANADHWEAVQDAALSLAQCLNQHGVIG